MIDPVAEHRMLVDEFARRTVSLGAKLVRSEGVFSKSHNDEEVNNLVARLSPTDRERLAKILEKERRCAMFDCLVILHEAMLQGLTLSKEGRAIPAEPYGYTLFEEYVALLDDERGWDALA
jgi:hypothetical protein